MGQSGSAYLWILRLGLRILCSRIEESVHLESDEPVVIHGELSRKQATEEASEASFALVYLIDPS